jgi:aryl-alcohol dehydrogenase-like predicted oxidoreductase
VVLATKGRFGPDGSPNGAGLSARHLTRALDASLRRLRLSTEEVSVLDAASDPGPPDYPYGGLGLDQRDRRLPAGTP